MGGGSTEFGVKESQGGSLGVLTQLLIGIRKSTARAVVDARIIEAETGRILTVMQGVGESKEGGVFLAGSNLANFLIAATYNVVEWRESCIGKATRIAVDQAVQKILENFNFEATVTYVLPDDSIVLDVGRFSGIREGNIFDVYRENEKGDEQTGGMVWKERKKISTFKVVELQDQRSKCVLVSASAEDKPQKGDVAVLLRKPELPQEPKNDTKNDKHKQASL